MIKLNSPAQYIVAGFTFVILLGTALLMLPVSVSEGNEVSFIDALFTSTSAVCVTGLVVVDTGTYWSAFGKLIIILLIQTGGLGFMTITTVGAIVLGRKIGIKNRLFIKESLGQNKIQGVVNLTKNIFIGTLIIESVAAVLLMTQLIPEFGFVKGLSTSLFTAVSGFCNAGFDIFGNYQSITMFRDNFIINIVIMLLIIIGGLGFTVIFDYMHERKFKKLSLHSKLALTVTAVLILGGTAALYFLESGNPDTIGGLSLYEKLLISAFQAVSPRTAGFNSIDLAALTDSSKFLIILLMFTGGSPASTAGGVKTTTLAVLLLTAAAFVRNKDVEAYGRRINYSVVNKAMTIIIIAFIIIIAGSMTLSLLNPEMDFVDIVFEVVSAFGTVGLTLGITTQFDTASKLVLVIIMFAGRVGALTIVMALAGRTKKVEYQLPEGEVIL